MLANTLLLSMLTLAVSLPVATLFAWLASRTDMPGGRLASRISAGMLFVPLYLQAAAWEAGFGRLGWYSLAAGQLGDRLLLGWPGAVWIHALAAIPWCVLIVRTGLRAVEPEWEEAALLDGSVAAVVWRVTLRRSGPALAVAGLWVLVSTAGEMTVTDLYQLRTYAEELYTGFALADEPTEVWRMVWPGLSLTAGLAVLVVVAAARLMPAAGTTVTRPPVVFSLGAWRWPALAFCAGLLVLLCGMPLGNLCFKAGLVIERRPDALLSYWSPTVFASIMARSVPRFYEELKWSTVISGLAATGAVSTAVPLAWLARRGGRRAWPATTIAALCLAVPAPLLGLLVMGLLNRDSPAVCAWLYDRTVAAPVLTLWLKTLPVALLVCWFAFRATPEELLEAAALDGAGRWAMLRHVILPLHGPALAAAWLAAYAVSFGDLAASILVTPPGVTTVPMRVFELIHRGVQEDEAALCLTSLVICLLVTSGYWWLSPKSETNSKSK